MPRRPNYKFERLERQRAKAAKKAARHEAKKEKTEKRKAEIAGFGPADDEFAGSPGEPPGLPQEDQPQAGLPQEDQPQAGLSQEGPSQEDGDPNR